MSVFLDSVIEFYITNQCNLACTNCNRFNDHDFRGHYAWEDSADAVEAWSQRINAPLITIIGGEPSLHPGLETWVANLRRLWPSTDIMIQSNGTNAKLGERLEFWQRYQVGWNISIHQPTMRSSLDRQWNQTEPTKWAKLKAGITENYEFTPSAVIPRGDSFSVHHSDPVAAFDACTMRHSHTIFRGRLYKCPVMAVLPEFRTQHSVDLDARQQLLLSRYQPLSADCSEQQLIDFVDSRHQHIDQCEFCPGEFDFRPVVFHPRKKL
jgi:hypothetical protein